MQSFLEKYPTAPAYFMLVVTAFCWGSNIVISKLAVDNMSPMMIVLCRWVGVVLLMAMFARQHLANDWQIAKKHWLFITLMGSLGFTVFNAMYYTAAKYTQGLNLGILQGSIPIFVLLGALIAYRTRISAAQAVGVAMTLFGVVVLVTKGDIAALRDFRLNSGDLLVLLACFIYAGYTVALRERPKMSPLGFFNALAIAALIATLPFFAWEVASGEWYVPTLQGWFVAALAVLLPSFLSQVFFIKGVEAIGPARAGVFVNLVPIFGSLLVIVFLGETFQWFHAAALVMVLSGIGLSERFKAE